ncbi:MAG: VWA domain-containing protein [Bacillota bacterium]|nr:VWA domain-containing protein [Bacillota bacterium]
MMAKIKNRKGLLVLLTVLLVIPLLMGVALAETTTPASSVQIVSGADATAVDPHAEDTDNAGRLTVNKTIAGTEYENVFDITLDVKTTEDILWTSVSEDAAVVLVIDTSSSMVNNNSTRLANVKTVLTAEGGFIDIYSDLAEGSTAKRYLAIVSFASDATVNSGWQDVATAANATTAKGVVNGLSASGGTNAQGGLQLAANLLNDAAIEGCSKHVIFLSDGVPTFHATYTGNDEVDPWTEFRSILSQNSSGCQDHTGCRGHNDYGYWRMGNRGNISWNWVDGGEAAYKEYWNAANLAKTGTITGIRGGGNRMNNADRAGAIAGANAVKNNGATLHTIAFDAGTTANALLNSLATSSGTAYTASNALTSLQPIFEAINGSITMGVDVWMVTDAMGAMVDFVGFQSLLLENGALDLTTESEAATAENARGVLRYDPDNDSFVWDLRLQSSRNSTTTGSGDGATTEYHYSLTYRVRLDTLADGFIGYAAGTRPAADATSGVYPTNSSAELKYQFRDVDTDGNISLSDEMETAFTSPTVFGYQADFNFSKTGNSAEAPNVYTALPGAGFTATSGVSYSKSSSLTGEDGKGSIIGLPSGQTYMLEETTVPEGFAKMANSSFSVSFGKVYMNETEVTSTDPAELQNKAEERTLTVTKQVIGDSELLPAAGTEYEFELSINEGEAETFSLADGASKSFTVQVGDLISLTETTTGSDFGTYYVVDGANQEPDYVSELRITDNIEIVCVNNYGQVGMSVTKLATGETAPLGEDDYFSFSIRFWQGEDELGAAIAAAEAEISAKINETDRALFDAYLDALAEFEALKMKDTMLFVAPINDPAQVLSAIYYKLREELDVEPSFTDAEVAYVLGEVLLGDDWDDTVLNGLNLQLAALDEDDPDYATKLENLESKKAARRSELAALKDAIGICNAVIDARIAAVCAYSGVDENGVPWASSSPQEVPERVAAFDSYKPLYQALADAEAALAENVYEFKLRDGETEYFGFLRDVVAALEEQEEIVEVLNEEINTFNANTGGVPVVANVREEDLPPVPDKLGVLNFELIETDDLGAVTTNYHVPAKAASGVDENGYPIAGAPNPWHYDTTTCSGSIDLDDLRATGFRLNITCYNIFPNIEYSLGVTYNYYTSINGGTPTLDGSESGSYDGEMNGAQVYGFSPAASRVYGGNSYNYTAMNLGIAEQLQVELTKENPTGTFVVNYLRNVIPNIPPPPNPPDPPTYIPEEPVPEAEPIIIEEEIPLADAPQTDDAGTATLWALLMLAAMAGIAYSFKASRSKA